MPEPLLVLQGEKVALGVLHAGLAPEMARWRNDLGMRQGGNDVRLRTPEGEGEWIAHRIAESGERRPTTITFVVHDVTDLAAVGWTTLMDMDHLHGTGTFGIGLGERRGQGLGSAAARLTLDWAFFVIGLRNVWLETTAWNEAAIRSYRAAGFEEIGRRRGAAREWGRRWDLVIMDAVPEGFDSPVLAQLVPPSRV